MNVWQNITQDLENKGWSIIDHALPSHICTALHQQLIDLPEHAFKEMGIGRGNQLHVDKYYRSDKSRWLDGNTQAEKDYLSWMEQLRLMVNQHLILGLFDYEAHFAHYAPKSFYKRHLDAFKGNNRRKLSTVFYLNPDWDKGDAGELLVFHDKASKTAFQKIFPERNRLVIFLSDTFPHEVLPANRNRYSIAG